MQPRASQAHVAVASPTAGVLVGVLCLAVSIVSAVAGHDFAIAGPEPLLFRLSLMFAGAGAIGALPFIPFVLWLSGRQMPLTLTSRCLVGAALIGAIVGEWAAPLVKMNPYVVSFPGVLSGAAVSTIAAALILASVSSFARQPR